MQHAIPPNHLVSYNRFYQLNNPHRYAHPAETLFLGIGTALGPLLFAPYVHITHMFVKPLTLNPERYS